MQPLAASARSLDELAAHQIECHAARDARDRRHRQDTDRYRRFHQARRGHRQDQQNQQNRRKRQHQVERAHDEFVDRTTPVAGDQPQWHADSHADQSGSDAQRQRQLRSVQ